MITKYLIISGTAFCGVASDVEHALRAVAPDGELLIDGLDAEPFIDGIAPPRYRDRSNPSNFQPHEHPEFERRMLNLAKDANFVKNELLGENVTRDHLGLDIFSQKLTEKAKKHMY